MAQSIAFSLGLISTSLRQPQDAAASDWPCDTAAAGELACSIERGSQRAYIESMRAVVINPPESLLAERRQQGADRWDEVWEGVLHMVPPPSGQHQVFGTNLLVVLVSRACALGLVASYETELFRPGSGATDYRVPDVVISRPEVRTSRGVEGPPEVVIELLSPDDESREKLPFYEALGAREVLLIDPETRAVELFVLREGKLHVVPPDPEGALRSQVLDARFIPVAGPRLRVEVPEGMDEL